MSNGTIDWTLGLKVRITTLLDDKITGTVYAFCHTTNTITLIQEPSSGESSANVKTNNGSNNSSAPSGQIQRPNYRIIKTSFVKEVIVISRPKQTQSSSAAGPAQGAAYKDAFVKAVPQIGHIDISRLNARAEAAVQAELKRRSQIGVGVSKEGQALFDMLSKTYVFCFVSMPLEIFVKFLTNLQCSLFLA